MLAKRHTHLHVKPLTKNAPGPSFVLDPSIIPSSFGNILFSSQLDSSSGWNFLKAKPNSNSLAHNIQHVELLYKLPNLMKDMYHQQHYGL